MAETVQRDIAGGPILVEVKDGLLRARGIRYATAARFEAPIQPQAWTETVDCTKPGAVCPQLPSRLTAVMGDVLVDRTTSEDCLFLSVTAPAQSSGRLPVMVWLHGGAYMSGGGDLIPYDPSGLVERGVVVVNINYRLGIFGAQEIPGISPANLGLQDQIAALKWVQSNISYLGGDPDNVTIFGQSAGADSCYCLLLADDTENLFHRAILQSPPWGSRNGRSVIASTLGRQAAQSLGTKARTASVDELLALQTTLAKEATKLPNGLLAFSPCFGAHPLPMDHEIETRLQHMATKKPIMIGWTAQDSLPFVKSVPIAQRISSIPLIGSPIFSLIVWLSTRREFASGSRKMHAFWLEHGGSSRTYTFAYHPAGNAWKASHCIELAFLLGGWEYWSAAPVMKGIDRDTFDRLGNAMKDLWVSFARGTSSPRGHLQITEQFDARTRGL